MCPHCGTKNVNYLEKVNGRFLYKVRCKCNDCRYEYYSNYFADSARKRVANAISRNNYLTGYGLTFLNKNEDKQSSFTFNEVFGNLYDNVCKDRLEKEERKTEKALNDFLSALKEMPSDAKFLSFLVYFILFGFAFALVKELMSEEITVLLKVFLSALFLACAWHYSKFFSRFTFDKNSLIKKEVWKIQRKRAKKIRKCINDINILSSVSSDDFRIIVNQKENEDEYISELTENSVQ